MHPADYQYACSQVPLNQHRKSGHRQRLRRPIRLKTLQTSSVSPLQHSKIEDSASRVSQYTVAKCTHVGRTLEANTPQLANSHDTRVSKGIWTQFSNHSVCFGRIPHNLHVRNLNVNSRTNVGCSIGNACFRECLRLDVGPSDGGQFCNRRNGTTT
jgi:hypothetical protein